MEKKATPQPGMHKRIYSTAFDSPSTAGMISGMTPVTKLIKEQQKEDVYGTPSSPTELESSLRRLSVSAGPALTPESNADASPKVETHPPVSFHEITLHAQRQLALLKDAFAALIGLFPESISTFEKTNALVESRQRRLLRMNSDSKRPVLFVSDFKMAFVGMGQLESEISELYIQAREAFKALMDYIARQPDEAQKRRDLAEFFTS